MSTLQQQIATKFLAKLAESKNLDDLKIQQLTELLTNSKRAKADDFVKIFTLPVSGDMK